MEQVDGALGVIFIKGLPVEMMVGDIGVYKIGIGEITSGDQGCRG